MKITKNITNWLEIHASSPSYGSWVLTGVAICYLGAAINTMAGWVSRSPRSRSVSDRRREGIGELCFCSDLKTDTADCRSMRYKIKLETQTPSQFHS